MKAQIQLHTEWDADVDNAISRAEKIILGLQIIKRHAGVDGLHDIHLLKKLDYLVEYELYDLHNSLEPVFNKVGAKPLPNNPFCDWGA